jgi:hypothetical protein
MKIVHHRRNRAHGSKVVTRLREHGHQAVPASPDSGVNTLTGEGVAAALNGAEVVVDVSNSPSFEDAAVLRFFETSTTNLLAAEAAAGVGHHVALSIVGSDRVSDSGYLRAKIAQEKLIRNSSIPYSIVRATQFFEFFKRIEVLGLPLIIATWSSCTAQPSFPALPAIGSTMSRSRDRKGELLDSQFDPPLCVPDGLVGEVREVASDGPGAEEPHTFLVAGLAEKALASPEHDRVNHESQLVDEVVLHQCVPELEAGGDDDFPVYLPLQLRDLVYQVAL